MLVTGWHGVFDEDTRDWLLSGLMCSPADVVLLESVMTRRHTHCA